MKEISQRRLTIFDSVASGAFASELPTTSVVGTAAVVPAIAFDTFDAWPRGKPLPCAFKVQGALPGTPAMRAFDGFKAATLRQAGTRSGIEAGGLERKYFRKTPVEDAVGGFCVANWVNPYLENTNAFMVSTLASKVDGLKAGVGFHKDGYKESFFANNDNCTGHKMTMLTQLVGTRQYFLFDDLGASAVMTYCDKWKTPFPVDPDYPGCPASLHSQDLGDMQRFVDVTYPKLLQENLTPWKTGFLQAGEQLWFPSAATHGTLELTSFGSAVLADNFMLTSLLAQSIARSSAWSHFGDGNGKNQHLP